MDRKRGRVRSALGWVSGKSFTARCGTCRAVELVSSPRGQKGSVYAARHTHINGKGKLILMHRYLLSLEDSTVHVDHANHDTLDNRRENIRECRNGENMLNKVKYCNNKSGFKGVCRVHTSGLYRARLTIKGKKISVGTFPTAEEAYAAYLSAAEEHHGEFACAG